MTFRFLAKLRSMPVDDNDAVVYAGVTRERDKAVTGSTLVDLEIIEYFTNLFS